MTGLWLLVVLEMDPDFQENPVEGLAFGAK